MGPSLLEFEVLKVDASEVIHSGVRALQLNVRLILLELAPFLLGAMVVEQRVRIRGEGV